MSLTGIKTILKNPKVLFPILGAHGYLGWMSDEVYLKILYYLKMGRKLNLKNPTTFNEKLQWLKLYDRKPIYTTMVDKWAVKRYVADLIGEEYVIPTLGVWESFDEIDFDALPDQFVLKCTHDSGGLVICRDKAKLNKDAARQKLEASLKRNYYWQGREWPYKDVKPRILAEEYMVDESGTGLDDYKIMCFDGEPRLIQVHRGRFKAHTQDFYTPDWNKLDIYQEYPQSEEKLGRPSFIDKMMTMSKELTCGVPHLRADWYYASGQIYFGELTFFDGSGLCAFEPEKWDSELGNWIHLE